MNTTQQGPSRWWYGVAVVIVLIGAGGFMATLEAGKRDIAATIQAMPRVTFPAGGRVELLDPGTYTLFFEGDPAGGIDPSDRVMPEAKITVTQEQTRGNAVRLEVIPPPQVIAYHPAGHDGYSVFQFEAPAAGSYNIQGALIETPDQPFVMAVGRLDVVSTLSNSFGIFGAAALLAFGFVVASVLGIVTYILRNKGLAEKPE